MTLPHRASQQLLLDRPLGRAGRAGERTRSVGFVSGTLEGSGGLELFELAAARGLAQRGWHVVCVYDEPGDLVDRWDETALLRLHRRDDRARAALADTDVLYVHETSVLSDALAFGRDVGRPVVGHLHLPPFHLRDGLRGRILGRHRYPIDDRVIGKRTTVARFIAVSNHTRRLWVEAGLPSDLVEVVHNGVDIRRFRPALPGERAEVREQLGIDDDAFVVGYVGRLDRGKGVSELLCAFSAVRASTTRAVQLVLVGDAGRWAGDDGAEFVRELHRTSPPGTTWLGKRHDVEVLYRALDLLVVPSQWDEPFGLVAAEALASGVPVIGTRRGGIPEVLVGPLAVNVVGTSWRELARGIRRHVDHPARGAELGREGRRVVEQRFDVTKTVEAIERVLRGVS